MKASLSLNLQGGYQLFSQMGILTVLLLILRSVYLSASIFSEKTLIKAIAFGGHEVTYQAWYGIDEETLETDRTYNPAGEIYDENGDLTGFYDNQVDDYKQDHYQLHINHDFGNDWTGNSGISLYIWKRFL